MNGKRPVSVVTVEAVSPRDTGLPCLIKKTRFYRFPMHTTGAQAPGHLREKALIGLQKSLGRLRAEGTRARPLTPRKQNGLLL